MPSQKKQTKPMATASAAVKGKSKSKNKTKAGSKETKKSGNHTAATSYTGLISNNGDFGDCFWNQSGSTGHDDASMDVNHGSEDEHGQGGHTAEYNFSGQGGQ